MSKSMFGFYLRWSKIFHLFICCFETVEIFTYICVMKKKTKKNFNQLYKYANYAEHKIKTSLKWQIQTHRIYILITWQKLVWNCKVAHMPFCLPINYIYFVACTVLYILVHIAYTIDTIHHSILQRIHIPNRPTFVHSTTTQNDNFFLF